MSCEGEQFERNRVLTLLYPAEMELSDAEKGLILKFESEILIGKLISLAIRGILIEWTDQSNTYLAAFRE